MSSKSGTHGAGKGRFSIPAIIVVMCLCFLIWDVVSYEINKHMHASSMQQPCPAP